MKIKFFFKTKLVIVGDISLEQNDLNNPVVFNFRRLILLCTGVDRKYTCQTETANGPINKVLVYHLICEPVIKKFYFKQSSNESLKILLR